MVEIYIAIKFGNTTRYNLVILHGFGKETGLRTAGRMTDARAMAVALLCNSTEKS